ncbi:hypothetical protein PRIPAC_83526, partial [Pristionchus pacificus]
ATESRDMVSFRAKNRQLEVDLANAQAQSAVYQIGNVDSGLRGLIIASDAEQKKMVEKLEKMNLDLNCHFNEANKSLLRARFTEISKLTETYTYSSSVKLAGMDWAIFVCTEMIGDKKYLSAYIEILSKPIPETRRLRVNK